MRLFLQILPVLLIISLVTTGCGMLRNQANAVSANLAKRKYRCLPEGTPIDTPGGSKAVESLTAGEMVIGFKGRPVKALQIHGYAEDPTSLHFCKIEFEGGAIVDLCDQHRIEGIRAGDLVVGARLKSGLVVKSIETYGGVVRSYDLLTEDEGYRINGIPVNSMIEEMYQAGRRGF